MDYCITVSAKHEDRTYKDLRGPEQEARAEALRRFEYDRPGEAVINVSCMPSNEYHNSHTCRDYSGNGCCEICGGVIVGSAFWRELNGGE